MRASKLLPAALLLLGTSQAATTAAPRVPAKNPRQPAPFCPMPASAAAPVAAARAAAARGDHRLLAYWQGGFAISLAVPGVRYCDADANRGGVRKGRYRVFAISLDEALTRQCCDRWAPDACGLRQQDYATAYNLEMIRVSRRRPPGGC